MSRDSISSSLHFKTKIINRFQTIGKEKERKLKEATIKYGKIGVPLANKRRNTRDPVKVTELTKETLFLYIKSEEEFFQIESDYMKQKQELLQQWKREVQNTELLFKNAMDASKEVTFSEFKECIIANALMGLN